MFLILEFQTHPIRCTHHSACLFKSSLVVADKRLILAVEKRWNFTLRDLDARAPAFDHFCSLIELGDPAGEASPNAPVHAPIAGDASLSRGGLQQSHTHMQHGLGELGSGDRRAWVGRRIGVESVRQGLVYERGFDLELLELRLPCTLSECVSTE